MAGFLSFALKIWGKKKFIIFNFVLISCIDIWLYFVSRPYSGGFVDDDIQKRLDLSKPRLADGSYPSGFVDFAVNMINLDYRNLFCVTAKGNGLRETLFYALFSHLQVYRTREEMLRALPCITDGAVSLDGGMINRHGAFALGNR